MSLKGFNTQWKNWMLAAQKGDGAAYSRLLTEIRSPLIAFFRNRARSGSAASEVEDFLQTCLLKIHVSRQSYDAKYPFEPWMYEIARNILYDHYSKSKKREYTFDDPGRLERGEEASSDAELDLQRALRELSVEQRQVIALLKIEGYSLEEAAKHLGISLAALKVRAHRAYAALERNLER